MGCSSNRQDRAGQAAEWAPQTAAEWAEAWDENGARYFYHTQTGETTWDAPEGW